MNCIGATCTAVGGYTNGSSDEGLIVSNASGSWTTTSVPAPGSGYNAGFNSVSCVGSTCTAVGDYNSGPTIDGLVATNASGSWTTTSVPAPGSGSNAYFKAIDCVGSTCTAVGSDNNGGSNYAGFVATNASGTWVATAIPAPSGGNYLAFNAINCVGTSCTAVGQYYDGTTDESYLAVNTAGSWVGTSIASPSGGSDAALSDVSCVGTNCTAVGGYYNGTINEGLVVTNESGSWVSTPIASPSGSTYFPEDLAWPGFQALSCNQQTCVAAGAYATSSSMFGFFVQHNFPPSAPTAVSARAGNKQAKISWSSSGQAGVTYVARATPGNASCTTTTTTCTISGLTNGKTYAVTVTVTNSAGSSDPSTSVSVTPVGSAAPVAVVSDQLAATGSNVTRTLGSASLLLGLGSVSVVRARRRRQKI